MVYTVQTKRTPAQTRDDIAEQFERWSKDSGAPIQWTEKRGLGEAAEIEFTLPGAGPVVIRHEAQANYRSNLRVIYLVIESLRLNEKRGLGAAMRDAYLALPAPSSGDRRDPYQVLGVRTDAPRDVVEAAYKARAKALHPDAGGTDAAMAELNAARVAVLG